MKSSRTRAFRAAATAATALVSFVGIAAVAPSASALTANQYDHTDPTARIGPGGRACNSQGYQINKTTYIGYSGAQLQVFYSTLCGTNWIRVTGNPYGGAAVKYLNSSPDGPGFNDRTIDYGSGSSYGLQMYAPGCIFVSVGLYAPGDSLLGNGRATVSRTYC